MTTPEPCVICGATIPQTIPPRNRKTCSAACRYTLNRMRWQANREAAAERKREALEALPTRTCESCGTQYKARNTARRTCGNKDCQKKQQAVYQQRKYDEAREERVTAKVHTARVKVTDLRTGEVRFEDRPIRFVAPMAQERFYTLSADQRDQIRNNEIADRIHHLQPVGDQ